MAATPLEILSTATGLVQQAVETMAGTPVGAEDAQATVHHVVYVSEENKKRLSPRQELYLFVVIFAVCCGPVLVLFLILLARFIKERFLHWKRTARVKTYKPSVPIIAVQPPARQSQMFNTADGVSNEPPSYQAATGRTGLPASGPPSWPSSRPPSRSTSRNSNRNA